MDDDVVLYPRRLFQFFNHSEINLKTYAGWFHNIEHQKTSHQKRADETFVLLGRNIVSIITSKEYCYHNSRKSCDSFGQLWDTNYGGTSLGIWLSQIPDVHVFPLNKMLFLSSVAKFAQVKPEETLIYNQAKTTIKAQEIYNNCPSTRW